MKEPLLAEILRSTTSAVAGELMWRIKYPVGLADMADAFRHLQPDRAGAELIARSIRV